jgi:hypothetical protein
MYYAFLVVRDTKRRDRKKYASTFLDPASRHSRAGKCGINFRKVVPIVIVIKSTKNPQRGRQDLPKRQAG